MVCEYYNTWGHQMQRKWSGWLRVWIPMSWIGVGESHPLQSKQFSIQRNAVKRIVGRQAQRNHFYCEDNACNILFIVVARVVAEKYLKHQKLKSNGASLSWSSMHTHRHQMRHWPWFEALLLICSPHSFLLIRPLYKTLPPTTQKTMVWAVDKGKNVQILYI